MQVDCLIEDARWVGLEELAERAFLASFEHLGMAAAGYEISLMGCDDARIADLNADFRGKPQPTNVLSWPAVALETEDGAVPEVLPPSELGDIAISYETCAAEAAAAGKKLPDHAFHLLVHGLLHLLGYDHIRDADAALMEKIEVEILGKQGLADPYCVES